MELLYAKKFSKDLDKIRKEASVQRNLLKVIARIRNAGSLGEINGVGKIQGYQDYYRLKIGDYRLGLKVKKSSVELIRFLHRKDIYRRFP